MNKIVALLVAGALFANMSFAAVSPASATVANTVHCNISAQWSGAIKTQYSNGVKLTYWYADAKDGSRTYCFLAQRSSAPKNTYINIAAHGVGKYGSLSATNSFKLKGNEKTTVTVSLFKKSGDNATTYWRAPPIGIGG